MKRGIRRIRDMCRYNEKENQKNERKLADKGNVTLDVKSRLEFRNFTYDLITYIIKVLNCEV